MRVSCIQYDEGDVEADKAVLFLSHALTHTHTLSLSEFRGSHPCYDNMKQLIKLRNKRSRKQVRTT